MFIGRDTELARLNHLYNSDQFEFVVIYGRRRVGKTRLIREFCKDKKSIYFISREANQMINLQNFSADVAAVTVPEAGGNFQFQDWETAFEYIRKQAAQERLILAIDEYPYLAQSFRPISSILQAHIDHYLKDTKLFLILCGSSMSFMENQVLGYKSPLYGRRTAQFKIKSFSFFDARKFMEGFSEEESAILYGATGGIPEYLKKINNEVSLKQNICDLFLREDAPLYEEPSNLLKQELREPSTYNGIIEAIAKGASRSNEIATKNGLESNLCAKYLSSLISLGIIEREKPINEPNGKKSIYRITDQMFRFWYRFIPDNMSSIADGMGDAVYERAIAPQLSNYMGLIFEQICLQYLSVINRNGEAPFLLGEKGRWWGNDSVNKKQAEIDVVSLRDNQGLFGECKWRNAPIGLSILQQLIEKSRLLPVAKPYYYLFSKVGFTDDCVEIADSMGNVRLVTLHKMISDAE